MADIAVLAVSSKGAHLASLVCKNLSADSYVLSRYATKDQIPFESLSDVVSKLFKQKSALIFAMAQGIAVRAIAPLIESKYTDPAVVIIDDSARFVISSLSGHEGGANALAYVVAGITGATPVITTATEANKMYTLGIGTRKGVSTEDVIEAIKLACDDADISVKDIRVMTSAWIKSEEQGLIEASKQLGLNLRFIPKFLYDTYADSTKPTAASRHFDIPAVAQPSALIASAHGTVILPAASYKGVMVAIVKDTVICAD